MSPAVVEFLRVNWLTIKYALGAIAGLALFGFGHYEGAARVRGLEIEAQIVATAKADVERDLIKTRKDLAAANAKLADVKPCPAVVPPTPPKVVAKQPKPAKVKAP